MAVWKEGELQCTVASPPPRQFWEDCRVPQCDTSPSRLDIVSAGKGQSHALWLASPRIKTFIYAKFSRGESQYRKKSAQCVLLRVLTSVIYMLALIQ